VGTTRAFESITVTTKTSGIIESVNFEEGQTVEAGHEIIRLDRAERRADLEATKAAILQEEARRNEVKTKLERAMALRRSGAGTEALVDDLTAQMRTADSAVQAAIARQRAAEARLNDLVIRAPFTGRVGVRSVSVGALVEPRTVVTTLDDVSKIRLDFAVPENLIARLSVGSPVSAKAVAFGGRTFPGEVAVVDTRVDPVTRSVRMTAVLDNASGTLKPGMFVNVSVEVARRDNAILIPEEAVVGEGPQQLAFVVVDGRVERRSLTIGQRQDGKVEVKEGLKAGETLVVRGVQRVRPGAPVTTRPVGAAGQGGPGQGAPRAPGQGAPGPSGAGQGGAGQGGAGQGGSLPGPAAPANAPSAAIPAAPGPAAQVQGGSAVPPSTVR
jgi:membrane fusion protein (multidrug efflux system)